MSQNRPRRRQGDETGLGQRVRSACRKWPVRAIESVIKKPVANSYLFAVTLSADQRFPLSAQRQARSSFQPVGCKLESHRAHKVSATRKTLSVGGAAVCTALDSGIDHLHPIFSRSNEEVCNSKNHNCPHSPTVLRAGPSAVLKA